MWGGVVPVSSQGLLCLLEQERGQLRRPEVDGAHTGQAAQLEVYKWGKHAAQHQTAIQGTTKVVKH